jgi:mono/diheme cytochrome c family protein
VPTGSEKPQIVAYRLGAKGETKEAAGEPEPPTGKAGEEEAAGPVGEPEEGAAEAEEGAAEEGGAGGEALLTEGKTAFTTNCASCHTLSEAGTTGSVGPNLDELKPEKSLVETQVTNGGEIMPAFSGVLSKEEIEAIAEYVSKVAGTGNSTLGGKSTGGGGGP